MPETHNKLNKNQLKGTYVLETDITSRIEYYSSPESV
jgi:hypothetical protein